MEQAADTQEMTTWMNTFKHLAECFFPPEPALRDALQKLAEELQLVSPVAAEHAEKMIEALEREDPAQQAQHLVDYAGLFVGPYQLLAPPFGSVYMEDSQKVMGDTTLDVLRLYQCAGVDMAGGFQQPPDHIAAELEFMSFLLYRQIKALQIDDYESYEYYRVKCRQFSDNHLGQWVVPFTELLSREAKTRFFQELAQCLRYAFHSFISAPGYIHTISS